MSDDKNSSLSGSEMGSSAEVEIYQRMERVRFERQQTILHENLRAVGLHFFVRLYCS